MQLLPSKILVYEPDDINRVILQFPTQNDAIIFFEFLRELTNTIVATRTPIGPKMAR